MKPTIILTWFLVENPGISIDSSPIRPMKSHEWVVCSLLFIFGNTETTPGISVILKIEMSDSEMKCNRKKLYFSNVWIWNGTKLTGNLRSLLVCQLGGKASESMLVTINVRCLCLLHAVVNNSLTQSEKQERKNKHRKKNQCRIRKTFQREPRQAFGGVVSKRQVGPLL